jgi:anti-sigma regulatory factor (Ser/Thr protein kinase)
VITREQIGAVMADGARVVDRAGDPVGLILELVLDGQTTEPAYVTVASEADPGVAVVVPLSRARVLGGSVQVPYTAADVSGAPPANASVGRLDRRQEEELRRYYAGLDDGAPAVPLRVVGRGSAAAPGPRPGRPRTPGVSGNGHRRTDARAARSLLVPVAPLLAGLDVHTGYDGPAAYPVRPSGPWPPVSTFSPGPPWWQRRQWRWPSIHGSVRMMRLELRAMLEMTALPADEIDDLVLAAGEAGANAVEHARLPTLPVFDVLTEVGEHRVRIVIQDHGRWRTPTVGGHRGRGLQMIGVLADATLTVGSRGTTVVLRNRQGTST